MHIRFSKNGIHREVKAGFSWTVLFFGPIPFAFRGQAWHFLGYFLLAWLTMGLSNIVVAFFANGQTARWLAERGWQVTDPAAARWGITPQAVPAS